jgi:uncharacterized protein
MIKPASGMCNMECGYCFYHDLVKNRRTPSYGVMTPDVIRAVVKCVCEEVTGGVQFTFQGGEPLLAGMGFFEEFEKAVAEFAPRGLRVGRSVQTNGTLIDDEWAEFLAKHGYLAGVSLDGPAETHNAMRPMAGGKGSFSRVTAGMRRLERHGVEYNVLTVVSEPVARRGEAVYNFMRKQGWRYLQFIPCIAPFNGGARSMALKAETYAGFLCAVFDAYFNERVRGAAVSVGWFEDIIAMIRGDMPAGCGMTGICAPQLVVEADGSAYPCDFYVSDDFRLGSLLEKGPGELLASDIAARFINQSRNMPDECRRCEYMSICRGGCRRYRDGHMDAPGKNTLCAAYRRFFDYAGDRLVMLARMGRREL